jgi:hypothetical protein
MEPFDEGIIVYVYWGKLSGKFSPGPFQSNLSRPHRSACGGRTAAAAERLTEETGSGGDLSVQYMIMDYPGKPFEKGLPGPLPKLLE